LGKVNWYKTKVVFLWIINVLTVQQVRGFKTVSKEDAGCGCSPKLVFYKNFAGEQQVRKGWPFFAPGIRESLRLGKLGGFEGC
jgi:hypothetical protein